MYMHQIDPKCCPLPGNWCECCQTFFFQFELPNLSMQDAAANIESDMYCHQPEQNAISSGQNYCNRYELNQFTKDQINV